MSEYHQIDYNQLNLTEWLATRWESEVLELQRKIKKSFSKVLVKELNQNWVRGFCRKDAANYVGVSSSKFDNLIGEGRMPKPIRIDGRVIWDRNDLDEHFDQLKEASCPGENAWFDNDPRAEVWT